MWRPNIFSADQIFLRRYFQSGFKSIVGGELKGLSKLTSDVRDELIYELKEKAATLGANAVVGLRWGYFSMFSHLTHTREEDSRSLHKILHQDRDQLRVRGRAGHGLPRHRRLLHQGREVIYYSRIKNIFMCIYKYFIKYHVSSAAAVSVIEQYKCLFCLAFRPSDGRALQEQ